MKKVVPFSKAYDISLYGAKAVGLGDATRFGLLIPAGIALSGDLVEAVALKEASSIKKVMKAMESLQPPFAVRSSAIDEDGAEASFAGQHLTLLNIHSIDQVPDAICEVWWSANSDAAITYRQRVKQFTRPSVGVVVQRLLNPSTAGVMFTENPITGEDERLIEASWGLGEAVVAGLVVPDHFRINRLGIIQERKAGRKKVAIRSLPSGGTFEELVPSEQISQLCLSDGELEGLNRLALQCEKAYGLQRDIEWAYQDGTLYLLQCRSITTQDTGSKTQVTGSTSLEAIDAIEQVQLFDGLNQKQTQLIANLLKQRHFKKGETIIMEGSGGATFYLIKSGRVTVSRKGINLASLGPGEHFGEIALIDNGPRSATVTAETDLVCYVLTYWEFRPLVEKNGTLGWKLLQALAKRLRS